MTSLRGRAPVVGFVRDVMPGERYAPVGAVVLCRYWGVRYVVVAHVPDAGDWRGPQVTVRDIDGPQAGRVRTHSTRLDPRDLLLSIPADTGVTHGPAARTCCAACGASPMEDQDPAADWCGCDPIYCDGCGTERA